MKVNGANRHPRCSIPIPPLVCQSMLRKRILRHVGSAGAAGACDTVISSTCGEPTSERARASACHESVDRTFLSRSVNPVEFPVEIRPKSSSAGPGSRSPDSADRARNGGYLPSTGLFGCAEAPFPKGTRLSVWPVGGRVFEEDVKAYRGNRGLSRGILALTALEACKLVCSPLARAERSPVVARRMK